MMRRKVYSMAAPLIGVALLGACVSPQGANGWQPPPNDTAGGSISDTLDDVPSMDTLIPTDTSPPPVCNNECCEGPSATNQFGNCTRLPTGKCVVGCDDNCANATLRCLLSGACTALGGECVVRGDADCQQSKHCKDKNFKNCVEGVFGSGCTSQESANSFCKMQDVCKQGGACKGTNGNCVDPADPTNCKKSYACQKQGRCSWDGNRCTALKLSDCDGMWCGKHCMIKYGVDRPHEAAFTLSHPAEFT